MAEQLLEAMHFVRASPKIVFLSDCGVAALSAMLINLLC